MFKYGEELPIDELPATAYKELVTELNDNDQWINLGEYVAEQLELG